MSVVHEKSNEGTHQDAAKQWACSLNGAKLLIPYDETGVRKLTHPGGTMSYSSSGGPVNLLGLREGEVYLAVEHPSRNKVGQQIPPSSQPDRTSGLLE